MATNPTSVQELLAQLLASGEITGTDAIGVAPQNGGNSNVIGTVDDLLNG